MKTADPFDPTFDPNFDPNFDPQALLVIFYAIKHIFPTANFFY